MLRFIMIFFLASAALIGCHQSSEVASPVSNGEPPSSDAKQDQIDSEAEAANPEATNEETDHAVEEDHHGPRQGHGLGFGRRMGRGGGFRPDMMTIHAMFDARDKITRNVKHLRNGAEAITESDDEAIASLIQEHVPAMESRVLGNDPLPPMTFHPVFAELIKNAEKYTLEYEDTEKGVKVTYSSEDPFVVLLVQEHAKLVSRFLKNGMSEIHKPYELPTTPVRDVGPKE